MNPFHLTGWEAMFCTLIGCGAAMWIVDHCALAAVRITNLICTCVTDCVKAWTDVFHPTNQFRKQ